MNSSDSLPFHNLLEYHNETSPEFDISQAVQAAELGLNPGLGQYSFSWKENGEILMLRDPLGSNPFFYGCNRQGEMVIANRIDTALSFDVPIDQLASCPPGHVIRWREGRVVSLKGFDISRVSIDKDFNLNVFQKKVLDCIKNTFIGISKSWPGARFFVCLSGGLDSSIIAYYANKYLTDVTSICFSHLSLSDFDNWQQNHDMELLTSVSDDFRSAKNVAETIGIPFRPVFRTKEMVVDSIESAVKLGQDWRDFNVHCAVVNLFLVQDISQDHKGQNAVVLTGDIMNELVCDYEEEVMEDGTTYYRQPKISLQKLRQFLCRGLDAGDREIGLFNGYGLPVIQPYNFVADLYMSIPTNMLEIPNSKYLLNDHLLPSQIANRVGKTKTRAQVGGKDGGILGFFHQLGIGETRLKKIWKSNLPGICDDGAYDIIQFGRYRTVPRRV